MLRLPLGLSIFIPEVRFDRSAADWLGKPSERLQQGAGSTRAGSRGDAVPCQAHNSILVDPIFSSRSRFLYLFYLLKLVQDSLRFQFLFLSCVLMSLQTLFRGPLLLLGVKA